MRPRLRRVAVDLHSSEDEACDRGGRAPAQHAGGGPRIPEGYVRQASPSAARQSSRAAARRARASAQRSPLRRVLVGVFSVLVVGVGLVIGLGTL